MGGLEAYTRLLVVILTVPVLQPDGKGLCTHYDGLPVVQQVTDFPVPSGRLQGAASFVLDQNRHQFTPLASWSSITMQSASLSSQMDAQFQAGRASLSKSILGSARTLPLSWSI